ncbi:LacI family DNA-binding transcriptional regulator [Rothia sp. ZJ932]|nr:LacI family DNA-binding transcriptional regulator [Rothia sp. ZJ932]
MEDVAKEAGVSRALVSLAYRNAPGVSTQTRQRILSVGEKLGYVHNTIAAQLATRTKRTVGVFIPDLHNDVFADIHDGIHARIQEGDSRLVLSVGKPDGSLDEKSLRSLQETQSDVIIALGLTLPDKIVTQYARKCPIVIVERQVAGLDAVTANSRLGGRMATEHLLSLGCKNIVFLMNPPLDGYYERLDGYKEAMREAALDPVTVQSTYLRSDARQVTHQLLDSGSKPDAILSHNDRSALGVLDALIERGLRPGVDIAVMGYDNTEASAAPGTSLSTVDIRGFELGRIAAGIALERIARPIEKPQIRVLDPQLVLRQTTSFSGNGPEH